MSRSRGPATGASGGRLPTKRINSTLRADPIDDHRTIFRTETRAASTDAAARAKFRRYWSLLSPGIIAIRWMSLGPTKREAERRAATLAAPNETISDRLAT